MALHDDDRKNCFFVSIIAHPRCFCKRFRAGTAGFQSVEGPAKLESARNLRKSGPHALISDDVAFRFSYRFRSTMATPWPPPMHALTIPSSFFCRFSE